MKSYEAFQSLVEEQGVQLDPEMALAAEQPEALGEYCFVRNDMLAAVAAAGHMLRRQPGRMLASEVFSLNPAETDTVTGILADMVRASAEPVCQTDLPAFSYDTKVDTISACDWADQRLGSTLRWLGDPGEGYDVAHAQIITYNDKPLFVRKGSPGHPSAINVRPFVLNGIPLPAGTILRVDTNLDHPPEYPSAEDRRTFGNMPPDKMLGSPIPWGVTVDDAAVVSQIGFGRLSTYALPPEERASDYLPHLNDFTKSFDPGLYGHVYGATMDDILPGIDQAAIDLA